MTLCIGIDLGTSTSEVAIYRDGRPECIQVLSPMNENQDCILPSVVAKTKGGSLMVGGDALELAASGGDAVREAKREMGTDKVYHLGGERFRPQEVGAAIIRHLLDSVKAVSSLEFSRVVVSVPAHFTDLQRKATLEAASLAGLSVSQLVAEPTAAAFAFGINNLDADERLMVFDFGGGTLDVSIIQMCDGVLDVERTEGDSKLGGKDIDEAIMAWAQRKLSALKPGMTWDALSLEGLKQKSEAAKKRLSTQQSATITVPVFGQVTITQVELATLLEPVLNRAIAVVERIFAGDARTLKPIDKRTVGRVLMVGGTTYMPLVRQRVATFMGVDIPPVSKDVPPDLAVALGACVRAAIDAGQEKRIVASDVMPFAVGVSVVTRLPNGIVSPGFFSRLIERNKPIPYSGTEEFHLMHAEQSSVKVEVYQGNSDWVVQNELLTTGEVNNIPASTTDEPRAIRMEFKFDKSGVMSLDATVSGTQKRLQLTANPHSGLMSEGERSQSQRKLALLLPAAPDVIDASSDAEVRTLPLYKQSQAMVERAEEILANRGLDGAPRTASALSDLLEAIRLGSAREASQAEDRLVDAMLEEGSDA
jgi:molecular chaperone DnaK